MRYRIPKPSSATSWRGTGLIAGREPPPKLGSPSAGRSEDADALAAYVLSLRPRRSPFAGGYADRLAIDQPRAKDLLLGTYRL